MKDYYQNFRHRLITKLFIVLLAAKYINTQNNQQDRSIIYRTLSRIRPCTENYDISVLFLPDSMHTETFHYMLFIPGRYYQNSNVQVKFDTEATAISIQHSNAIISKGPDGSIIYIFKPAGPENIELMVTGPNINTIPHIQSIIINDVENCKDPQLGILDQYLLREQKATEASPALSVGSCGRRKIIHTELIVSGQSTKPGDWPWHVAIYLLSRNSINYICGGTLLSKTMVLTAAHCVTIRGVPRTTTSLSVILGKYNLIGGDIDPQEREVQEIKVHEQYEYQRINNDIALVELKSEVIFTDYVQPACLWDINASKKIPHSDIYGTVVGWGFDQTTRLSYQLKKAKMPIVSELTCIRSHPFFYIRLLNAQKFCAGYNNGTSACNGDSGGGFMIFVPDITGDASANATGAWHVRGIVSTSVSRTDEPICDPNHYVLFTDVAKFRSWILSNMN